MRLHEPLIAMRRRGLKPAEVWVEVDGSPDLVNAMSELNRMSGSHHVVLEPSDTLGTVDLRFLTGCTVYVQGGNERRVRAAFAAIQDHGAERVIAFCSPVRNGAGDGTLILDSAGLLTQPKELCCG